MATNKKITDLPAATLPITTGVKFEAVQGGLNVQVDADDMPGSAGGGAVDSVNGQTGVVVLDASDVGADPSGTAAGLIATEVTNRNNAITAVIIDSIADSDTTHAPSRNAVFDALAGKQASLGFTPENSANKDATGGYAGLTLLKINFKNALNTFTSFFTNSNTAARTYTFQDRNGTIADDTDLALKAPIASPTFTGTPAAPTPSAGDSSTKLATTAFVAGELGFSFVSVTGAITLDSTAFGKMHLCTGTTSAYTIGLPTAVGNANKSIAFKGSSLLTVNVTIDGNGGETLDGEDSRQFNAGGLFVILSDGTNWHIVAEVGSWVTYTPVWTGLSADPVMSEAKYWRTGKNCTVQFRSGTDGTSNATTKTITFPFNAYSVIQFASITSVRNNGTTQTSPGYLQTRANSNVVDLFRDAQSLAWTATGGFRASGTIIYQVQ